MKASYAWLRELVSWPADFVPPTAEEAAEALTRIGFEVEGTTAAGDDVAGVLVAEVLAVRPHPQADKLRIVRVRAGDREEDVVCGAPNVPPPGFRVCWAPPGARLPGGRTLEAKEVRGVLSPGMLCSEDELGIAPLGAQVDGILILSPTTATGVEAVQVLGLPDVIFEVNVTPNRPDALSHLGLARELAAAFYERGVRLRRPDVVPVPVLGGQLPAVSVDIAEAASCPRYLARVLTGLEVGPSPPEVRVRLGLCGVRPISNIVDVTNYVLLETGHPLHAFDLDRLAAGEHGPRVGVRRAREGETLTTLDGTERALLASDLVITDGADAVALAGVMGGASTEVTASTRRILLEAATFDPVSVRRTSRRLGLISEASYRFERSVDPEGVPYASARAAALLRAWAGGAAVQQVGAPVDRYVAPQAPRTVTMSLARATRLLGTAPLSPAQVVRELAKVEVAAEAAAGQPDMVRAQAPSFRPDLAIAEDLVEEVARLSQLHATPPDRTRVRSNARSTPSPEATADRARDLLAAAGLLEVMTWGFVSRQALAHLGAGTPAPLLTEGLPVKNPISADYEVMRTSLLPGLAATFARNQARGARGMGLFEVGPVIRRQDADPGFAQETYAAALVGGNAAGWLRPGAPLDVFDLKRVVEDLLAGLQVAAVVVPGNGRAPFLHPGVSAHLAAEADAGANLGAFGEVHPVVARKLGLEGPVYYAELALDRLAASAPELRTSPPPRFPAMSRDISFWIDVAVPAADQRQSFLRAGEPLLRQLAVLEDFRDPKYAPAGKKGMLWSLVYQSADRTLTDAEVDAAHARVVDELRRQHPIQIR